MSTRGRSYTRQEGQVEGEYDEIRPSPSMPSSVTSCSTTGVETLPRETLAVPEAHCTRESQRHIATDVNRARRLRSKSQWLGASALIEVGSVPSMVPST